MVKFTVPSEIKLDATFWLLVASILSGVIFTGTQWGDWNRIREMVPRHETKLTEVDRMADGLKNEIETNRRAHITYDAVAQGFAPLASRVTVAEIKYADAAEDIEQMKRDVEQLKSTTAETRGDVKAILSIIQKELADDAARRRLNDTN